MTETDPGIVEHQVGPLIAADHDVRGREASLERGAPVVPRAFHAQPQGPGNPAGLQERFHGVHAHDQTTAGDLRRAERGRPTSVSPYLNAAGSPRRVDFARS